MDEFEEDYSPIEWDETDMQVLAESRYYARMPADFGSFELFTQAPGGESESLPLDQFSDLVVDLGRILRTS